jgi:activator of 2-hydroxyglutaryl-CoA dehydratase
MPAGNGYFLQGTAQTFGFMVEDFADIAFSAEAMPSFGYGCASLCNPTLSTSSRQG